MRGSRTVWQDRRTRALSSSAWSVLALAEFRGCGFADATSVPATRLTVRIKQPETEHTVSVGSSRAGSMVAARARMSMF